jgi:hypothetical protein
LAITPVLSLQQVEETATLAVAGIEDVLGYLWQALSRHHQHVGAMLSQCACSHRPGQDAGEVQGANAAQGAAFLR